MPKSSQSNSWKNFVAWIKDFVLIATAIGFIYAAYVFAFGKTDSDNITPMERLFIKLSSSVPDNSNCILTSEGNIIKITKEFVNIQQGFAESATEMLKVMNCTIVNKSDSQIDVEL